MNESEIAGLFALFIGCFLRTMAPFIRKWSSGECEEFDHLYTVTFLISFIVAGLAALTQFAVMPVPTDEPLMVFALYIGVGWGSNDIINEILKVFMR